MAASWIVDSGEGGDDFEQPPRGSRRWSIMDLDLAPAPGRHPIRLSARWHVVALEPIDGVLVLGFFFNGELVQVIDEPAGEA